MSQHDMVIENQGFAATRADINAALAALVTNNSGTTEPATTYPYMWWPDTGSTPPMMRQRNAADDGWVSVFVLSTGSPLGGAASGDNNDITRLLALVEVPAVVAAALLAAFVPDVPQTVLYGPVDTNGFAAFGGSTGTATLTTAGTLKATCFAGSGLHRVGSIANAAFTSPGGTGTAYPYLEISAAGVVTAGVSTLPWVYQPGGTPSVTNGQHTVNTQEGKVYVGNGSVATQVYRVCIGECPHTSGSWSGSPIWYAIKRRYTAPLGTAYPSIGVRASLNHRLGMKPKRVHHQVECISADVGFSVGDVVDLWAIHGSSGSIPVSCSVDAAAVGFIHNMNTPAIENKSTGVSGAITLARWNYVPQVEAGW